MEIEKLKIYQCKPSHADFTLDEDENPCIVETAGFVPLEVKFKQFEQNGLRVQFTEDEFTSSDMREIYLNPDLQIYPGDDLIDIENKLEAQQNLMQRIQLKKQQEQQEQQEQQKSEALASDSRGGEPRSNNNNKTNESTEETK